MALFLVPALKNTDITFRFTPNFRHPAVRTMVKLSSWTFGYVVTNQIALIIIKNLASPGSGDQDAYSKAFTFFMLPHGLLAISIATTFVPELVRRVRAGDLFGFATWTTSGVRWISILTIPASVAMVILAHPIISSLLEHGNFNGAAASNTARALAGFSVGLTGFSLYIFCLRGFYAHEDTRTPFYVNVFENVLNVIFALILVDHYGVFGLGISFGMAYMIASLVLLWLLHIKYQAIDWGSLFDMSWRVLGASSTMGVVVWSLEKLLDPKSGMSQMAELFICVTAGFVVYAIAIYAFRLKDLQNLSALLPKRNTDVQTTL
jgi:putative peptidoglycan lipid II flippase